MPATGRRVHNAVDAQFVFVDGSIAHHRDNFDLYRWIRQAFGLPGLALGWTPMQVQAKVRDRARHNSDRFEKASAFEKEALRKGL